MQFLTAVPSLSALLVLTAIFFLNFFSRIIFSPLLPSIEKSLSISHGAAGTFFLFLSLGYFVSLVGSGYISSRIGHKKTIILSMFAISIALQLIALITDLFYLKIAFLCLGIAAGIYLPSGISTISDLFTQRQWGRAYAVHELAPNLAFLTAPLFASLLLPYLQWRQTIYIIAAATFFAALIYTRLGRGSDLKGEPPNLANCTFIFSNKNFIILVLLFILGISGTIGVFNILPLFLVTIHNLSLPEANLLVGFSRLATLFSALAGGWLADRLGNKKTISFVLLLTGISTICIGFTSDAFLITWIFIQPVLAVCFFPAGFALLAKIGGPEKRNVVISLAIPLAFVIGGGLFPSLVARMADIGMFQSGIILMGILISLGTLLTVYLRPQE